VDEAEMAVRIVLGQQVSIGVARTHAARLVEQHGTTIADAGGGLTHVFPSIDDLSKLDPTSLHLPATRQRCVRALVDALAAGRFDLGAGADWERTRSQLAVLPGIGPWTVEMIAMRALGDPDAFPTTDAVERMGATTLDLPCTTARLGRHAQRWRPWRAYAAQHLWGALDHPINNWPPEEPT
jgi:AraC family transcriptional regulator of adaptative response / DNA-3-methyladenine glycosylase II